MNRYATMKEVILDILAGTLPALGEILSVLCCTIIIAGVAGLFLYLLSNYLLLLTVALAFSIFLSVAYMEGHKRRGRKNDTR